MVVVAVILSAQSVFILDETQQAIVTQFGKPVGEPRTSPGVNIVVPFIQKVQFLTNDTLSGMATKIKYPQKTKSIFLWTLMPAGK